MLNAVVKYSLGSTAAIITSLGIIAGLARSNDLKMIAIASLLTFAIADNISDAFGIHVYKESEGASRKNTFKATYGNFLTRLTIVCSFILIVYLFDSEVALIICCIWGLGLLSFISYKIAIIKQSSPLKEILWHLVVSVGVVSISMLLGNLFIPN